MTSAPRAATSSAALGEQQTERTVLSHQVEAIGVVLEHAATVTDSVRQAELLSLAGRGLASLDVSPHVARAIADIRAAQETATPAVADFLDSMADLITETGDPSAVFARVLHLIEQDCA